MNKRIKYTIFLILAVLITVSASVALITFRTTENTEQQKIGYIMTGSIDETGWNGMNYKGVKAACDKLEVNLLIKENIMENTGDCAIAIDELAKDGAEMIILSSYGYPSEVTDIITSYPDIAFYGISADFYSDNMTSYFGRMYQARYLSGIIAGYQTVNGKIGYVAAMPNNEVNRSINAFTLGVKRVNPEAEVIVIWTDEWDNEEKEKTAATTLIKKENVELLAYHQNQEAVIKTAEKAGIYSIGYNSIPKGYSEKCLTAAVWNWEHLYTDIVRDFIQGKANTMQHYWCGINTGAVFLSEYSSLVSDEAKAEVEKATQEIISGIDVFSGEIYDNNGQIRCEKDEFISDNTLMSDFDWYVDGVRIYE